MGLEVATIALIGAGISAAGTVGSYFEQKKAARLAQAQNIANQSQQVQSSSALTGVQSSITSQLGANIGAQQQMVGNQFAIQGLQQGAASALRKGQERAGLWGLAGQFGQMAFTAGAGGLGKSPTSVDTSAAGASRAGYTGSQFQNWVN
jgi:hypothetical protein